MIPHKYYMMVPGELFKCKRGVKQGHPLSPLLFLLGAKLLKEW
jgi:hypothetical protein